ncbi:MAG: nucleoside recognition domain-containing protein, partial [Flavitalea sp.]
MVLSYIWCAFFLVAFIIAFIKWSIDGDQEIFKVLVEGIFKSANDGFDISLKLVGVMSLFLGFMKIGEKAGAINFLSRIVGPFFSRLFPEVPKNHPATGQMMMNFSANLLGLDNAATPFGLKAMESLQELNKDEHGKERDTASNAQIMFLTLHASGLTL